MWRIDILFDHRSRKEDKLASTLLLPTSGLEAAEFVQTHPEGWLENNKRNPNNPCRNADIARRVFYREQGVLKTAVSNLGSDPKKKVQGLFFESGHR